MSDLDKLLLEQRENWRRIKSLTETNLRLMGENSMLLTIVRHIGPMIIWLDEYQEEHGQRKWMTDLLNVYNDWKSIYGKTNNGVKNE